jgi:hypothetical protein
MRDRNPAFFVNDDRLSEFAAFRAAWAGMHPYQGGR